MFENKLMLAGLGGAVVPIVIHLLGRARYRTIDWGAMMFVTSGEPRWRDGAKLREWALLLIRVAAVAMLAIALARPLTGGAPGGSSAAAAGSSASGVSSLAVASPDNRVAAAIVVDCSASMAYEDVGGSRMERASSATLQILSTLRRGDRAVLVIAGAGQNNNDNPPQMTGDLQSLVTRATELKPTPGVADLAEAIATAANLLDRQERFSRQLYVVCDRQAASWRFVGPDLFAPARNHAPLARFAVVPVGGDETDNVSIESIALLNPPAVRGCATQVSVRIHNHGPLPRTGIPLLLRLGGKDVFTETLNIGGGEAKSIVATLHFDAAGANVLTAELSGAGPNLDDRRSFIVDVSPPLRVLIVRGGEDDATMLKAALAPYASAHREGDDLAQVSVVPLETWDPAITLPNASVVVLHDVPAPTPAQSAALEQFVYAGGGLLIAPGPAAQIDLYNQRLYRDESGLLPAMLSPPIAPESEFSIDPGTLDTSHPLLRLLAQHTALVTAVTAERFIPTERLTPAAHVLAEYERGGGAFMIESAYGRGRVVLMSGSLGASWSNLPLTNLYLPLLQSTVSYLAGANVVERNVGFGQELLANFTPPAPGVHGEVIRPDGSRDECDLTTIAPRTEARYRRTDYPGLYTLRVGPRGGERSAQFSVGPPPVESDLTPLTEADWQRLEKAIGFRRLDLSEGVTANVALSAGTGHGGGEYWLAALTAVMVLLVVELAMTRAWAWEGK